MMTPETINLETLTEEEAQKILQGMQKSVAFIFHALDTDGDGKLSPAEIDAAPEVLRLLDKDGDGEVVTTWSYKGDPPEGMFAPFMSGVDRTPSGNTVFAFGHNKRVIEVTPDGEVVADFRIPGPGNTFRVRRYPFDFPGLKQL